MIYYHKSEFDKIPNSKLKFDDVIQGNHVKVEYTHDAWVEDRSSERHGEIGAYVPGGGWVVGAKTSIYKKSFMGILPNGSAYVMLGLNDALKWIREMDYKINNNK